MLLENKPDIKKIKIHKNILILAVMSVLSIPLIDSDISSAVCYWQGYQIISGVYCQQGLCPYDYGNAHQEKYCVERSIGVTNCGTFNEFVNDRLCNYSGCTSSQCPNGAQDIFCKGSNTIEILTQMTSSCIALLAGDDCAEA